MDEIKLKPWTPQKGLSEDADSLEIKIKTETLVEILNLWENDCYPSADRSQDFFELHWDLVEQLASFASAIGLKPSEPRCDDCNAVLEGEDKCHVCDT